MRKDVSSCQRNSVQGRKTNTKMVIDSKDGTLVSDPLEVKDSWKEYTECLYEADQTPAN